MSKKSEAAYTAVFRYLDEHIIPLKCQSFMMDYEHALRNGLKTVSPEAKVTSCWFHFVQVRSASLLEIKNKPYVYINV